MVKLNIEYNSLSIPIDYNSNSSIRELKDTIVAIFEIFTDNFKIYLSEYGIIDSDEIIDLPIIALGLGIIIIK
jgi:hypothetical protein